MMTTTPPVGKPERRGAGWFMPSRQDSTTSSSGSMDAGAIHVPASLAQDRNLQAYRRQWKGGGDG